MMDARFENQLRAGLSRAPRVAEEHPDGETLTCFSEGRLSKSARRVVIAHLSSCAACREIVSLTARPVSRRRSMPRGVAIAAAAALVLVFAGSISRIEEPLLEQMAVARQVSRQAIEFAGRQHPGFAYATAEMPMRELPASGAIQLTWRVRQNGAKKVLEASADRGRTWRPASIDRRFEPESVGFKGPNVWVTGRSGEVLVTRDAGREWFDLRPLQTR